MHGESRNKVLLSFFFFNNNHTCLGPRGSSFTCKCSARGRCVTVAELFVFNNKFFCGLHRREPRAAEGLFACSAASRAREGADSSESRLLQGQGATLPAPGGRADAHRSSGVSAGGRTGQLGAATQTGAEHQLCPGTMGSQHVCPQCPTAAPPASHSRQSAGLSHSPPGQGWESPRSSTRSHTPTVARTRTGLSPISQTLRAAETPGRPARMSPPFSTGV